MAVVSCNGDRCDLERGYTLFHYADKLRVRVPTSCGRQAACHECIVEVTRGGEALGPRTDAEAFLRGNYRLACQAVVDEPSVDIEFVLPKRRIQVLTHSVGGDIDIDPFITRSGATVCRDGQVLDRYRGHLYGLAIDIGTTTLAVEVVDLETGSTRCVVSLENPQGFGGSDVMSRISYDSGPYHGELRRSLVRALNRELEETYRLMGVERHMLYDVVVVGNATMRDIFFGIDVSSIGQRPYKSITETECRAGLREGTAVSQLAHRIGLFTHPKARVFGAPLVASHVGADTAAGLLAVDMASRSEPTMLVDIGTNTEVVVGYQGRLIAASCPAGPAFEGGLIKYGMVAEEGAVEALRFNEERWQYRTVGDASPKGICGSGLIDLLAEMRAHGLMTPKGVFANRAREVSIVPEHGITFSRDDMSQLAQAKAATYCGQYVAMRTLGIRPSGIERLYLAGGFANYVNVHNAVAIGFLAPVDESRVVKVGNTALAGAKQMLLSRQKRQLVEQLVKGIEHVELETAPDFFEIFVDGCQFKPMPDELA